MEPEVEKAGTDLPLTAYWDILRRRRLVVIQTVIAVGVVGTIITLLTKPVWEAKSRLVVEPPAVGLNNIDSSNPLSSILTLSPTQDVSTQVAELQSQPLFDLVRAQVGVEPAFAVKQEEDTNVIAVSADANTPKRAKDAANALLQDYLDQCAQRSVQEIHSARQFAHDRAGEAHGRLQRIQAQLQQFKQKNQISDFDTDVAGLQNRSDIVAQQIDTGQTNLKAIESQIEMDRRLLALEPESNSLTLRSSNPEITSIQNNISQLEVSRIAMTQKGGFTANSAQVMAVDAQIAEYKKRLARVPATAQTVSGAANPVRDQLRSSLLTLEAQEAATQTGVSAARASLEAQKGSIVHAATWELAYQSLMRKYNAAQADDKLYSDKEADLWMREQAYHATAHVLETARRAELVRPKRFLNISLSLMIGLFLGICLALLQDMLDDRISSMEETGRLLTLPSLGAIPLIPEGDSHLLTVMSGKEPAAESYRTVRTNVHFASVDSPIKTLLVTSAHPGEGKSTTATNIAMAMALDGKSVILIDTDLRKSNIHKLLNLMPVPGLTDVLFGHVLLDEALQTVESAPNLRILTGGSVPPNPSEVLNSQAFTALAKKLVGEADIVIFDSPPVLIGADAAILASQMDATMIVVAAGSTKKQAAAHAVNTLRQARARLIGVAYNKMSTTSGYGYYYYNHYHYNYYSYSHSSDGQDAKSGRKWFRRKPAAAKEDPTE